jgi:hypothetical protein
MNSLLKVKTMFRKTNRFVLVLLALFIAIGSCNTTTEPTQSDDHNNEPPPSYSPVEHPEWAVNATIYEVNIRQYTSEGTFDAFT